MRTTLIVGLLLCAIGVRAEEPAPIDAHAWLADLDQLESWVAALYPNLDAQTALHHLDLPALDQAARAAIGAARTPASAQAALAQLLASFADGHLKLGAHSEPPSAPAPPIAPKSSGEAACRALHAGARPARFRFPMSHELGFTDVPGGAFPAATLALPARTIGFVRIASFDPLAYDALCADAWTTYRATLTSACDADCQDQFTYVTLSNRLLRELAATIRALQERKIDRLVLDLTDNGGGSDWVGAVTRMLTAGPIVCGQFGFVRHAHWTEQLEKRARTLEAALRKPDAPVVKLQAELTTLRADIAASRERCDRSAIWHAPHYHASCDVVVRHAQTSCVPDAALVYQAGLYHGPLSLLVNDGTASASEDLVGRHKDSHTATIMGARTLGAGCGYTNGGIALTLPHSHLPVKIPDCARYSKSGVDESEGIAPNVTLDMNGMDSVAFSTRLRAALAQLPRSAP